MPCEAQSIRLELFYDGESPSGRATAGGGVTRAFAGWLGLIAAVDALVACEQARPNAHQEDDSDD